MFVAHARQQLADTDSQTFKAALWDLVWAGQITNDTFAPLRALGTTTNRTDEG